MFGYVWAKRVVVELKFFSMNQLYIGPLENTSNDFAIGVMSGRLQGHQNLTSHPLVVGGQFF